MEEEIKITYLNKSVKIIKFNSESNNRFNQKLNFLKILESQKVSWKEANKLAKIWYNIKFYKCKYSPYIYNLYMKYNNLLN
jgi:hypothetical protein